MLAHDSATTLKNFPSGPHSTGTNISPYNNGPTAATGEKDAWGRKKEIQLLLVDHNWDQACLTSKFLSLNGRYRVEVAVSGSEALYKLVSGKFSLMLLDYCLSGMSGLHVLKKIKALNYHIPVIMVTGLGSETVAVEVMKHGAYDYLVKRENYLDALPSLIDQALEKYELEKIKAQWDHWMFKRTMKLGTLTSIFEALGKSLDPDKVLKEAVEKTAEALHADYHEIRLRETLAESAFPASQWAAEASVGVGIRVSAVGKKEPCEALLEHVIRTGESLVLEDTTTLHGWHGQAAAKKNSSSVAYLPLKSKEKVLGVMILGSHRKLHFTQGDLSLLNTIGNQIGSALENAHLYDGLRKRVEKIQESENQYRTLVEEANDAILIVQGNRVPYANKKASALMGYSREELYRMDFLDLVAWDKEVATTYCAAKMNGKDTPNCEIVVVGKGGREVLLEINGSAIEYKNRPALQIIARDRTEQKQLPYQLIAGSWV